MDNSVTVVKDTGLAMAPIEIIMHGAFYNNSNLPPEDSLQIKDKSFAPKVSLFGDSTVFRIEEIFTWCTLLRFLRMSQ